MRQESIKKLRRAIAWGVCGFLSWLAYCAAVWLLVGCKSIEYVPVVEHKTDTTYITKNHRDSIYMYDSTYIHERGDTVWIERWHTRWRDIYQIDTIYETVHDTLPVGTGTWQTSMPRTRPPGSATGSSLTWWQQTRIYIANIAILAGIVIIIILYVKRKLKP
jgi:hypothetical protein